MAARITSIGIPEIEIYLESRPQIARRAARLAINDTTRRKALPGIRKAIQNEVSFPAGYVNEQRLAFTKQATDANLSATITARFRPTSLARFAQGQSIEGARRAGGVRVRVKGSGTFVKGAFFVRLRQGADTQDGFNLGLAIRLKPGSKLRGRRNGGASVQLAPNLYLLYGPSVDQIAREVYVTETPKIGEELLREFTRQWIRLNTEG